MDVLRRKLLKRYSYAVTRDNKYFNIFIKYIFVYKLTKFAYCV